MSRELVIITSYPTRVNGIIVLVNSQTGFCRRENLAHYFPYDVKLQLLAQSRSFLANQNARDAIVGAENLLKADKPLGMLVEVKNTRRICKPLACGLWFTHFSRVLPTSRMVYQLLYNNQINTGALIGQSAVGYCYYKPTEKSRVF